MYLVEEIDAAKLEYSGMGVDDYDIVEMAVAGVHVDSIGFRTRGAMDVRVGHENLITRDDPESLEAAVADHQEIEGGLAGAGATDSSAYRIAIQHKVVENAAVASSVLNVIIVEIKDMLHRFRGHDDRSSEIDLDVVQIRMCNDGLRDRIGLSFMGDKLAVVSDAIVERLLQCLCVVGDAVTYATEHFRSDGGIVRFGGEKS